jgi:cyclopropane-fatty-acyl-phospholipid synthase
VSIPDIPDGTWSRAAARVARGVAHTAVQRVPVRFTLPDGEMWGRAESDAPELHVVHAGAFFRRLGRDAKMALGDGYVAGEWEPGPGTDLGDLLTPFAERVQTLVPAPLRALRALVERRVPHMTRNSRQGARHNISTHYDMSNEMFSLFLDESMTYSSGYFEDLATDTLEAAQHRKIDAILDAAEVTTGTRLLEIGTGWGALAIQAAERGADVTTITLSQEQAALATERIKRRGLDPQIDIQLLDYRDVQGSYDAIVSVEMIEAVGEEFWPQYFSTIDRHLAPGGRVAIQAITMAHDRMLATRHTYSWMQKRIFPGGLLPSIQAIEDTCARHTSLHISHRRELAAHYAETLRRWRGRFLANWEQVEALGYDEDFRRLWEFYLAYCEAGFRAHYINVSQMRLVRAH